eukprot:98725_1
MNMLSLAPQSDPMFMPLDRTNYYIANENEFSFSTSNDEQMRRTYRELYPFIKKHQIKRHRGYEIKDKHRVELFIVSTDPKLYTFVGFLRAFKNIIDDKAIRTFMIRHYTDALPQKRGDYARGCKIVFDTDPDRSQDMIRIISILRTNVIGSDIMVNILGTSKVCRCYLARQILSAKRYRYYLHGIPWTLICLQNQITKQNMMMVTGIIARHFKLKLEEFEWNRTFNNNNRRFGRDLLLRSTRDLLPTSSQYNEWKVRIDGEVTGRVATISRPFHYYNTHTNDANMKMDETEIRNEFDKNLDSHLASDANDVDMAAGKKNNHYINNNRQHSGANPSAANK